MAFIKLDFPTPEFPVMAMFTSTSCHPFSFVLKNSLICESPWFSTNSFISFWTDFSPSESRGSMTDRKKNNSANFGRESCLDIKAYMQSGPTHKEQRFIWGLSPDLPLCLSTNTSRGKRSRFQKIHDWTAYLSHCLIYKW